MSDELLRQLREQNQRRLFGTEEKEETTEEVQVFRKSISEIVRDTMKQNEEKENK